MQVKNYSIVHYNLVGLTPYDDTHKIKVRTSVTVTVVALNPDSQPALPAAGHAAKAFSTMDKLKKVRALTSEDDAPKRITPPPTKDTLQPEGLPKRKKYSELDTERIGLFFRLQASVGHSSTNRNLP